MKENEGYVILNTLQYFFKNLGHWAIKYHCYHSNHLL